MKRLTIILALVVLSTPALYGAREWSLNLSYATAAPTGNLGNYIDRYSWVGFSTNLAYHFDDHNYVGIHTGWQRFDALYRNVTQEIPTGAVYGSQLRIVSAVPLMVTIAHNLGDPIDAVQPYMSLGAGMYFMTPKLEIGMYQFTNSTTHFGLMPSVGMKFRVDRKSSLDVSFDYNAAVDSGENFAGGEDNSFSWIGIKLGFTFGQ